MVKVYRVSGYTSRGMKFTLEIPAEKPHDAVEKVYSLVGSRHRVKRVEIKIENVTPVENVESENVKLLLALDKISKH